MDIRTRDPCGSLYHGFLGFQDLEGGPCSQQTSGDEDGVIKYDTGGVIMTTHFVVDQGRNADRAPEGEVPDEHACPPRDLDASRMEGAAPAFYVRDLEGVVAGLRRKRPDFRPQITRSEIGLVALCVDPGGHRFFLYEPSDEAMRLPSGRKIAAILDASPARGRGLHDQSRWNDGLRWNLRGTGDKRPVPRTNS